MADAPPPIPASARGLQAALPGARSALTLLIVINLVNYIDRYNLAAVAKFIEFEPGFFAADDTNVKGKIGLLSTAFMVSYMIAAPFFGWIGDRFSRWQIIAFGVAAWSLATGACGLAGSFWILFAMRCLVGIGEAAYGPAAPAIISDFYPVAKRGTVIAWFYVAIPVGSALGYALGGVIAHAMEDFRLGWELAAWWASGWRWVFYLMTVPGLVLAAICLFMKDPPRGGSEGVAAASQSRKDLKKDYWTILSTPSYLLVTLGMTAMTFAVGGVAFWMPAYVFESSYEATELPQMAAATVAQVAANATLPVGLIAVGSNVAPAVVYSSKVAGVMAEGSLYFGGITVVAGLLSTLAGGWLGDLLRNRGLRGSYFWVSGVAMFIGFGLFLAVLWIPFPMAYLFLFLAVFCLFFNTGPTNTILANVVHPSMRGSAVALNILIIHGLGDAISPAVIGVIADRASLRIGFLVVSVMILLSGVLWCWGARYLEEDTAKAPFRLEKAA